MHPQAAPPLCYIHQRFQKTRQLRGQSSKFVDHHQKAGQGRVAGGKLAVSAISSSLTFSGLQRGSARRSAGRKLADAGCLGGAEKLLTISQLSPHADQRSFAQSLIQIGNQSHHMGQAGTCVKRTAAFVVNQHEVELFGRCRESQRCHETAHEFAFA